MSALGDRLRAEAEAVSRDGMYATAAAIDVMSTRLRQWAAEAER